MKATKTTKEYPLYNGILDCPHPTMPTDQKHITVMVCGCPTPCDAAMKVEVESFFVRVANSGRAGSFLDNFAKAYCHADLGNKLILRTAARELYEKYKGGY